MLTHDLPLFDKDDYDAFLRLLNGDIPATHAEWDKLQTDEVEQFCRYGHHVKRIKVDPDEFARFCADGGTTPNLQLLMAFARKLASKVKDRDV